MLFNWLSILSKWEAVLFIRNTNLWISRVTLFACDYCRVSRFWSPWTVRSCLTSVWSRTTNSFCRWWDEKPRRRGWKESRLDGWQTPTISHGQPQPLQLHLSLQLLPPLQYHQVRIFRSGLILFWQLFTIKDHRGKCQFTNTKWIITLVLIFKGHGKSA